MKIIAVLLVLCFVGCVLGNANFLTPHNNARKAVGQKALVWDTGLYNSALAWAQVCFSFICYTQKAYILTCLSAMQVPTQQIRRELVCQCTKYDPIHLLNLVI